MACDNRCCFDSVCVVEQALIEHQTLIRSYSKFVLKSRLGCIRSRRPLIVLWSFLMPIKRRFTDGGFNGFLRMLRGLDLLLVYSLFQVA